MVLMRNGPVPAFLAQPDSQTKARPRVFFRYSLVPQYGGCERNPLPAVASSDTLIGKPTPVRSSLLAPTTKVQGIC
jgi:hypothetical protein